MAANPHDAMAYKAAVRTRRQRGCTVYIPADDVTKAFGGRNPDKLFYRVQGWGNKRVLIILDERP